MSTTHCETNIVRIRVDLLNDILRFDYALQIFFCIFKNIIWYDLTLCTSKLSINLIYCKCALVAPLVLKERTILARDALQPQAPSPCVNFSHTSSFAFQKYKRLLRQTFIVMTHTRSHGADQSSSVF